MKRDPIVEEARKAGQAYIDSFRGDWKAIIADLHRRFEESGRRVIAQPSERQLPRRKVR